jgi:TatA/E family protein of Tat protein translocase
MLGIGTWELLAICLVILLLFGHRLPKVMYDMGDALRRFRLGMNGSDGEQDRNLPA